MTKKADSVSRDLPFSVDLFRAKAIFKNIGIMLIVSIKYKNDK